MAYPYRHSSLGKCFKMNPWDRIKKELEAKLSPESYQNWISRLDYMGIDGVTLVVGVPDEGTKRWMEAEYATEVLLMARRLVVPIKYVIKSKSSLRTALRLTGIPLTAHP